MENRRERALNLHNKGYNCCQSVCIAFADKLNIDEDVLFKISEGFGLGMGDMQGSCGALSAATIIAGLYNSGGKKAQTFTKASTYHLLSEINAEFVAKVGALYCKDIKGIETGNVIKSCNGCIEEAVNIINNFIFNENNLA